MEEGNSGGGGGGGGGGSSKNTTMTQQHQHLLQQQQQQLYLLHQYQQQQQHQTSIQPPQQQQQQQLSLQQQQQLHHLQQQQAAISRFPSNIDAHLRPPGLRSLHLNNPQPPPPPPQQQQQQISAHHSPLQQQPIAAHHPHPQAAQQQQQQQMKAAAAAGMRAAHPPPVEVEMALQDAFKVCNPNVKSPFASLEDAVLRLLPYHVVSDFEAEEDDRILDSDTTGQISSRLQQWDHNILAKIAEFTGSFEKQVLAFNIMSRKRALGEFRSEERLMLEQALLQEEKQALLKIRAEIESREKASREAEEAKIQLAMVQAEHARAEAQAQVHAEMFVRQPMRSNAIGSQADEGPAQDMGQEQGGNEEETMPGWGNAQREEEDPSEDFLNDDNEPENGDAGLQEEWREAGELDLNSR